METLALRLFAFCLLMFLSACARVPDRIAFSAQAPEASLQHIFVSSGRPPSTKPPPPARDRNASTQYLRYSVSVPPTHALGKIEWPDGPADPLTDFTTVDVDRFQDKGSFIRAINSQPGDEVTVFIHGYNTTSSEALYRYAQVGHDFKIDTPRVLFSWPSSGTPAGYVYDRDSILFSRDPLADLLTGIGRQTNKRITLLAHSMGSHLTMEVLRQLAISGRRDVLDRLEMVVLLAPDIDPDIFQAQSRAIGTLPDPFIIMTNQDDRALTLSTFISIGRKKVGHLNRARDVAGLNVTLFDFTALEDGANLNHLVPLTSPTAISVLRDLVQSDRRGALDLSQFVIGEDGVIRARAKEMY